MPDHRAATIARTHAAAQQCMRARARARIGIFDATPTHRSLDRISHHALPHNLGTAAVSSTHTAGTHNCSRAIAMYVARAGAAPGALSACVGAEPIAGYYIVASSKQMTEHRGKQRQMRDPLPEAQHPLRRGRGQSHLRMQA